MKKARCSTNFLVALAFSAAISLAAGHLVNLGIQVFGSGPVSTPALIGDLAGLTACAISVWFGLSRISRSSSC